MRQGHVFSCGGKRTRKTECLHPAYPSSDPWAAPAANAQLGSRWQRAPCRPKWGCGFTNFWSYALSMCYLGGCSCTVRGHLSGGSLPNFQRGYGIAFIAIHRELTSKWEWKGLFCMLSHLRDKLTLCLGKKKKYIAHWGWTANHKRVHHLAIEQATKNILTGFDEVLNGVEHTKGITHCSDINPSLLPKKYMQMACSQYWEIN